MSVNPVHLVGEEKTLWKNGERYKHREEKSGSVMLRPVEIPPLYRIWRPPTNVQTRVPGQWVGYPCAVPGRHNSVGQMSPGRIQLLLLLSSAEQTAWSKRFPWAEILPDTRKKSNSRGNRGESSQKKAKISLMKFSWSQWAQKEDFSPRTLKKCDFHWTWFFFKRRKTTSFNEPTKPGQIISKETEVRRSTIDTKEKFNDHIPNIDFIITNGDQFRTSGTIVSNRNIPAESPPSWNSWSRPLMANLGKSTTFAM